MSYVCPKRTTVLVSALLSILAFNQAPGLPAGAQDGARAGQIAFGSGTPQASTQPVQGTGAAGQNPRAVSLYNLGLTAFRQGSPESAIIFFKRACDIDPNLADAQYNLAVIYQSQKRFRDAIPRYEEVLRLKPTDPDAHYQIGVILFDMGRFSEARAHFNAIAPNNVHFSDSQRRLATMNSAQSGSGTQPAYGTTFDAPPVNTAQPPAQQPTLQPPVQQVAPPAVQPNYGGGNPSSAYGSGQPAYGSSSSPAYGGAQAFIPPSQQQSATPPVVNNAYNSQPSYGGGEFAQPPVQQPSYATQPPAQQPIQQPVAIVAPAPSSGNPVPVLANTTLRVIATGFNAPAGLAFDRSGNLYVANFMTNTVDRIASDGSRTQFSSGVNLRGPIGLAVDELGNLYVANYNNGTVARINPAGVSTVIATNLRKPYYLTLDREGNLYVSQQEDNSIVRISLPRQQASSKPQ